MESLKEKVMIVNLTISQWGARKYDKTATKEVEDQHQAKEAGRFNKILIQSDTLSKVSKISGKLRQYHYDNTLPWGDNGDRILSVEKYFQYIMDIGNMKMEFTGLIETFIQEYEKEKEDSKIRLNSLYKESDYPPSESIAKKFDIVVSFMPIADGNDLRVNMSESVINSLKNQITKELENRVNNATEDLLQRLREAVTRMVETLSEPTKIFRDTLVGNIEALTEHLPLMNFNNDQRITDAVSYAKGLCVNPEDLRKSKRFKREILAKAKQVLSNI